MLLNAEMTPKTSARGFWVGETELELRRLKREDFRFKVDNDLERAMEVIEEERRNTVYDHPICNEDCKSRGTPLF